MNRKTTQLLLIAGLLIACNHGGATDIVAGDVTSTLGPHFFIDDASQGGGENKTEQLEHTNSNQWGVGATVTLKGIGWALPGGGH